MKSIDRLEHFLQFNQMGALKEDEPVKPIQAQLDDLQRELNNLEEMYRQADDEWRAGDAEVVSRISELNEMAVHKSDLKDEITWRTKEIAALQEAVKLEATI